MKINSKKALLTSICLAVPMPFFVKIGGNPVYYLQGALFSFLFIFLLPLSRSVKLLNFDKLLIVYICWNILSYLFNVPFALFSSDASLVVNQLTSLVMSLVLMTPYCVGRNFILDGTLAARFVNCLQVSYVLAVTYIFIMYTKLLPDLFLAREIIGQRIPLVFALFSTMLLFYWCLVENKKLSYLLSSLIGGTLVVISLTRAAYIQIGVSLFCFFIYLVRNKKVKLSTLLYLSLALVVFIIIFYFFFIEKIGVDPMILIDRLQQISQPTEVSESDESASVRITIWLNLISKLVEHPIGLLFGFGQLGPSYVGVAFVSLYGEVISNYSAHNQYLDTIIRSGFIGLFLEIVIFIKVITYSLRQTGCSTSAFYKAVGFSLIGVMCYSVFHETLRYHMFSCFFWFYAGLLISSTQRKSDNSNGDRLYEKPRQTSRSADSKMAVSH